MPKVADCILMILEAQGGQVEGVQELAAAIPCACTPWLRKQLRQLAQAGELDYITGTGGRGRRAIIRKRNRNTPGRHRRVRR